MVTMSGHGAGLRAGASRIDVTPEQPVVLAGYASRTNLSEGVHDPLSARALAFEQDGRRLVLVSLDNLGFYNDTAQPLRQAILEKCHLEPSALFLCAIHTHSAPLLTLNAAKGHPNNVAYTKALGNKLADVVRAALDRLAPAEVGVGLGSSPVGVSRREVVHGQDGKLRIVLGRNPSVLTDREVQILKLERLGEDQPAALLFAYATHSTSLGPKNYQVSGDIHGLAAQFLEHYFGGDLVAPEFAGASGNIDPWVRVLPGFKSDRGWVPETVLMSTLLAEEVARVEEGIRATETNCPIKTARKTIRLPAKPKGESGEAADGTAPIAITVARLGGIAFVGLGGEVFNELGAAIKSASPFRPTFILTHCNGAAGYVPARPGYAEGGYEVQSSSFAPGGGEQLVAEAVRMLQELQ
jgi:Neutral/alkaline non-lysosomal ceramidase, N-terminal